MGKGGVDREIYRGRVKDSRLFGFRVQVEQTDLFIRAEKDLSPEALSLVRDSRSRIVNWSGNHPDFLTSLEPQANDPLAPPPVKAMLAAGQLAGVGPMAAVAGGIADFVGSGLQSHSPAGVIVENGGDIFLASQSEITVGIYAGDSPLSMQLGLVIKPEQTPVGVCTSSRSIGHSLSLGRPDTAMVVADSAALADAAATGLGNRVSRVKDIEPALAWALDIAGVRGAVVIIKDRIGFLGDLQLISI